jgi:hypothetical protein
MIDADIVVVQLPPCDPGAVGAAAGFLETTASSLAQQAGQLTGQLGAAWQGEAARVWAGEGRAQAGYLRRGSSALGDAAAALRTFATAIQTAQTAATKANGDARDAFTRRQAQVETAALAGHPAPPDGDYRAAMGKAESDGQAALRDLERAGRAAAAALRAAAAAAPTVAPIPGPAQPRGPLGNMPPFITLLLGSVVGNNLAGRAWQETVLRDLGLDENFSLVPPELLFGRSRPDGLTETEMYELKNVLYQSFSRQLRVQLRYADRMGLRYNLIVNRVTRISGPLRAAVNEFGGRILRYQGNGLYEDVTNKDQPVLYRRVDGRFERVSLQPKSITEDPQAGGSPGPVDGEGGTPEEPAPEEPVVPEDPEPEIPLVEP